MATLAELEDWYAQYYQPQPQRRLSDLAQIDPVQLAAMQQDNAMGGDVGVRYAQPQPMPENYIQRSGGQPIALQSIQQQGGMSLNDLLAKTGARIQDKVILSDRGEGYRTPYGSVAGLDSQGRMWEIDKPIAPKPTVKQMKEYFDMVKAQKEAEGVSAPKLVDGQWVYPPSAQTPQGRAVPLEGFKKPPTEDERKTAYNVGRILQSAKMIQGATSGKGGAEALSPGFAEAAAGEIPSWVPGQAGLQNLARSDNRQIVNQSQADIIDSLLYLATGAAYNKEQLQQQRASYLPNFTDSPEAINAKNERMRGLIDAAKVRSGNAWTPEMDAAISALAIPKVTTGASGSAPKQGQVVKGYVFLGGDPANKASWKKAQ